MNGDQAIMFDDVNDGHEDFSLKRMPIPVKEGSGIIPVIGRYSKSEIEDGVANRIRELLETEDAITLYTYFKQLEAIAKNGLEQLKEPAISSFLRVNGGATTGTVLGHKVTQKQGPCKWVYSEKTQAIAEKLKAAQELEKVNGKATKIEGGAVISVTLS